MPLQEFVNKQHKYSSYNSVRVRIYKLSEAWAYRTQDCSGAEWVRWSDTVSRYSGFVKGIEGRIELLSLISRTDLIELNTIVHRGRLSTSYILLGMRGD